jgi:hypothetical protein
LTSPGSATTPLPTSSSRAALIAGTTAAIARASGAALRARAHRRGVAVSGAGGVL